jgi:hypothetical protein
MVFFFSSVNRCFRKVDLFPSNKLLRYNGDIDYTTTTGGILSVVIIAVFVVLFANMGIKTLRREIIDT